ncbi:MAG: KamA family radical SAM protein [Oceanicaulis sp.]
MPLDGKIRIAGSRPKKKAVSRRHKDNLYARIEETKFQRYVIHDIARYRDYVENGGAEVYSQAELDELEAAGVSDRLPPRATGYYLDLARRSEAVKNLIKARPEEMDDLSGEADPSNQLKYSPTPGLLHKYELILLYVVRACSSWCRYCYRSDFLTGKTEKDTASIHEIKAYVTSHNAKVASGEITDKPKIREALLSGGDPMVLSNRNLFDYLNGLAEAGLEVIRIGTKEMAFFPERFDANFFEMLDLFHELHPQVLLAFMVHFTHPDEFLRLNEAGEYVRDEQGRVLRNPLVENAARQLRSRPFVTLENQTPIIDSVNDDADTLRLMQQELKRMGVNNHYFFQCREIEGHRAFAVPVETAWKLHAESQHGLSGIERSRFALSTEAGKMELVSVIEGDDRLAHLPGPLGEAMADGIVVFRLHRTPHSDRQSDIVIARRNPDALWITGYEDRILYDGRVSDADDKWGPLLAALAPAMMAAE